MEAINQPSYARSETLSVNQSSNPLKSIEEAIERVFPQHDPENSNARTRNRLGNIADTLSEEQLACAITQFQFLIDTWLNEYEQDLFNGLTLKEVINEQ